MLKESCQSSFLTIFPPSLYFSCILKKVWSSFQMILSYVDSLKEEFVTGVYIIILQDHLMIFFLHRLRRNCTI